MAGLLLLVACKPQVPSKYLQPDEMEDLMYDYYVSQGFSDNSGNASNPDYQHRYNLEAVLRKYGLTDAEFDSSLVYYYNHMEQMKVIYNNIQERLSKEALELGASEGEVERFTVNSLSGDTADVWEGHRRLLLMPVPPYHVTQFSQKADTSFHQGDSFLLTFGGKFLAQSGAKTATAYMAVTYDNDSVVSTNANISPSGGTTLRIGACDNKVKRIDGFFYMPKRSIAGNESDMCLLFIDHIQLMRFHHHDDTKKKSADSTKVLSPPKLQERTDSIDSLKPRIRRLGERPMTIQKMSNQ